MELVHDLTKFAHRDALLQIFNAMQGPVGKADLASEVTDSLISSLLPQILGEQSIV